MSDFMKRLELFAKVVAVTGFASQDGREYVFESRRHPGKYFCGYVAPYITPNLTGNESAWYFRADELEKQWKTLGQYFTGDFEPVKVIGK